MTRPGGVAEGWKPAWKAMSVSAGLLILMALSHATALLALVRKLVTAVLPSFARWLRLM